MTKTLPITKALPALLGGDIPQMAVAFERLRALETTRKTLIETHAQHETQADKLEAILNGGADLTDPATAAEVGNLQTQVQLLAIRFQQTQRAEGEAEDALEAAMLEAVPAVNKRIRDVRDTIIKHTAEQLSRWFAKKSEALRIAHETDAANELFHLGWKADNERHHLNEMSARRLVGHLKELAEIEALHLGKSN